ncbi:GTP cyclohydrolase I [Musa troglodytarum]|uniref:GTP cyclohydrolase 1 n=1 Tax=Musa troglodytarum TaxID=320322 RepID=A0A9E7EQS2_9LILI|nr:GTP cyclohydrolase I [Musa troglodytarum]
MGALDAGCCFEDELDGGFLEDAAEEIGCECGVGSGSDSARAIEDAVRVLLQGLGEDHEREGLRRTPHRVAKAFREGTSGYKQKVKDIVQGALFPEAGLDPGIGHAGGAGGLVVVRDINLFSYCESCLLPFSLQCHVGYVPLGQRVVGLSKLSRVADVFARRLQDPQRLAIEICSALHSSIKPAGVAVALQCWHIQFPEALTCSSNPKHLSKLAREGWVKVSASSSSGVFTDDKSSVWDNFLALLKLRGVDIEAGDMNLSHVPSWCPLQSLETPLCNGHGAKSSKVGKNSSKTHAAMVAAVASILHSLGEDPLRKELVGTPYRYVQWLMNFKSSNLDLRLNGLILREVSSSSVTDENVTRLNEILSVLNIPFCSQCEHHVLPFHGVVHIGYLDEQKGKCIEASILRSMVHSFACKLQVQERLTRNIAEAVYSVFNSGVMVVVEARHICMISRGIEKVGSNTATIAVLGQFSTDPIAKHLFLQTIANNTCLW